MNPKAQTGKSLYIWWLKTIVIYKPYATEFETWMLISYFNILLFKHKYFDSQTAESEVDLAVLRPKFTDMALMVYHLNALLHFGLVEDKVDIIVMHVL